MARLDSSLKIVSLFSFKSSRRDFLDDPILNFSNFLLISFICSSSCKKVHWDTPSTRRSISNCGLLSTNDTEFRTTFHELVWSSRRVALDIFFQVSTATSFPELEGTSPEGGCCCCWMPVAFQCHHSVRVVGLRVLRIVCDLPSERLLCRCTLPAPNCVRLLHVTLSARNAILDLVLWNFDHINGVLITIGHFPGICDVIIGCFFIWIFT